MDPNVPILNPSPNDHDQSDPRSAEAADGGPDLAHAPRRRSPVGHPVIAWLVIIACVAHLIWQANRAYTEPDDAAEQSIDTQTDMTGKLIVGITQSFSDEYGDLILKQVDEFKDKPKSIEQRLCYTVFVAEYMGPEQALADLDEVEVERDGPAASQPDKHQTLIAALRQVYVERLDPDNEPPPTPEQLKLLKERLGWFGRLAPVTKGTPDVTGREALLAPLASTLYVIVAISLWYLMCGLAGFVFLIVLLVRVLQGKFRSGLTPGRGYGGIYIESFAIYVLLWVVLRKLVERIATQENQLLLSAGIALLTTSAAFWPLIRGVPWRDMRQDLGLFLPRRPLIEPAYSFMTYMMGLPLTIAGVAVMFAMMKIQKHITPDARPPSHPIQETLMGAGWSTIIPILVLGVIIAPICEEIMFRGVLYRHLRDATGRWGTILSGMCSAVVSSFVFAAIHPQGWVFIPVLMSLAFAFCLAREWRETLMTSMIAHGITNLVTLSLNILLFSGV